MSEKKKGKIIIDKEDYDTIISLIKITFRHIGINEQLFFKDIQQKYSKSEVPDDLGLKWSINLLKMRIKLLNGDIITGITASKGELISEYEQAIKLLEMFNKEGK